eukprot:GFUD01028896.1.p2 GENE.GFUD01028896.1~~GFUD01028896.1.p2  ORF type:complete len:173 (-),score=46.44 GFUD01028896.1:297-815(-)
MLDCCQVLSSFPSIKNDQVSKRHNTKQSETDKQSSPDWSVGSCSKLVYHGHYDGTNTKHAYAGDVHNLVDEVTVEAIIDPRNAATNNENGYPGIVKLVEDLMDMLRVAEDGVEHHGEGETGDCTNEEENEDQLITEENITTAIITERLDIEDKGDDEKTKKTQKMCPNVSSF